MSKATLNKRVKYFEKTKPYRTQIEYALSREDAALKNIGDKTDKAGLKYLDLAEEMTFIISNCIILNSVSLSILKVRNDAALNEGRKSAYKALVYLEKTVSPLIDAAYSEYESMLLEITSVDAQRRYNIIRKLGLSIQLLKNAFGVYSKWRWAFVEMEGRYAAVAKNIIDLKKAVGNTDPRSIDYEPTVRHLRLIKKLLQNAADRYRQKYESFSRNSVDIKMGIQFLESLRRIHIFLGERKNVETTKKIIDVWKMRLDGVMDKQGEESLKILDNG